MKLSSYGITIFMCKTCEFVRIKVRLGEWNTDTTRDCDSRSVCADPIIEVPVAEIFPHEGYKPRVNDIALIKLKHKVKYSKFIRPICLPLTPVLRAKNFVDEKLTATGWGKTEKCE